MDGSTDLQHANRLFHEKSPYLLQHARNPVDWYPWGEEAFTRARDEDRPIFLSIGYATCHWCHVMERESFEDPEVAGRLNENFVAIKVDREERPDVDQVYMAVCQDLTGSGGWPLTIVMTPDKRPFFAGTYIPRENRFGRVGMLELLPLLAEYWRDRRPELDRVAESVATSVQRLSTSRRGGELGEETLVAAHRSFVRLFDSLHGGFGGAPKFPTPHNLAFLLRQWRRTGDDSTVAMVETTLQAMRRGGLYDQVGFGFHRYSTDIDWLVPHFEKMLYDQALLAMAYIEAWQATGKDEYATTAREIFEYVLRDMTSADGAFFSAEDADSEGVEGKFYVWTEDQLREVLDADEMDLAREVYGVRTEGNFSDEASGEAPGANILHLPGPVEDPARTEAIRQKLFAARGTRIRPLRDDKVLTDWNGLMIAALARATQALGDASYAEAAARAARFVLDNLRDAQGKLLHRWRDGEAAVIDNLDDHAFLVWGLIELYEATFDVQWLEQALALNEEMLAHFSDPEGGGFFFTSDDGEALLVRAKSIYDGALPSGNSVAALNLLRLGRLTGRTDLERHASDIMAAFAGDVAATPASHTHLLQALDFALGPTYEIVIAGDPQAEDTRTMLESLGKVFLPNKVVLLRRPGTQPDIAQVAEYAAAMDSIGGRATAYVCRGYQCQMPTTYPAVMLQLLGSGR
jgi:hypothetical protein